MKRYIELTDGRTFSPNKCWLKCICSEWHPIRRNKAKRLVVTCPHFKDITGIGKKHNDLKKSWIKNSIAWIDKNLMDGE